MTARSLDVSGALSSREAKRRARAVRLVLTDCDGVLTDAGVYYGESGEMLKRFSIRDGMGVERLRNAGISTAIVTGERSESVKKRAEKLEIRAYLGVKDKVAALDQILTDHGAAIATTAYIGDDVNDLRIMERIGEAGLVGSPSDGFVDVRAVSHYVTRSPGGHGAFRDFAEWILSFY